ncbi:MarR family winged helix-turn-helix transcriptional regulator [Paenibacillus cremeus]|uniref:MarR family transcriptional regulator n=1 Tax=Paenibacillus cremeus TaxID=2163881 RepID=A0A559K6F7_9BACL|nr:MarR family transcriptional regulator [Paenibacillus cremeus]TVY07732.1 MarR family transcriptional regulator [Paenibacillus cremeus]
MNSNAFHSIEYELALLVRLATSYSPRPGGLDRSEYLLLCELSERGPIGINEVAELLLLNISTASRQVATLEKKNYITRYPDPTNGRISLLQISPEGKSMLDAMRAVRSRAYEEIFKDWSSDEVHDLTSKLGRLNRDLKRWRK